MSDPRWRLSSPSGAERDSVALHRLPIQTLIARAQRLRDHREELAQDGSCGPVRIAILADFTTRFLARILDVFLFEMGLDSTIYEPSSGGVMDAVFAPDSGLYAFRPDLTLLLTHHRDVRHSPPPGAPIETVRAAASQELARWTSCWTHILERIDTQIVQSNLNLPPERTLGNLEGVDAAGALAFVRRINALLSEHAQPSVTIFDLKYIASRFGVSRAMEARQYYLTRQPFAFEFLPVCCHELSQVLAAHRGRAKKCIVLDLDGTLWGGNVDEDDVAALEVGPNTPAGEAFAAFQRYLKQLKNRGILLAICSKNDPTLARHAFETHPHMVLKSEDIACFVASWDDKPSSIVKIARALEIDTGALVFVDDSPAERSLVRQALPHVAVVDLPEDPADYVQALHDSQSFDLTGVTVDARQRTRYLRDHERRSAAAANGLDYDAFLRDLEMNARVLPVDEIRFARCVELIQRTNQFNLRSIRHSGQAVQRLISHPDNVAFCIELSDRFGAMGVISLVILEGRGADLVIDTWLISCRALRRGVEHLTFQLMIEEARRRKASTIVAEYRASRRNGLVAGVIGELGFRRCDHPLGHPLELWSFAVGSPCTCRHYMAVEDQRWKTVC